jgi:hypothetical protein
MSWHNVIGAILALAVMSGPALACKGGEELASDDFTDGTAWTDAPEASFGSGKLSLKPKPDQYAWVFWNNGYFDDADVCVDITYPSAKKPDGGVWGGLIFFGGNQNPTMLRICYGRRLPDLLALSAEK